MTKLLVVLKRLKHSLYIGSSKEIHAFINGRLFYTINLFQIFHNDIRIRLFVGHRKRRLATRFLIPESRFQTQTYEVDSDSNVLNSFCEWIWVLTLFELLKFEYIIFFGYCSQLLILKITLDTRINYYF